MERPGDGLQGQAPKRDRSGRANVVLATNGYTGGLSTWHQRRVIPIRQAHDRHRRIADRVIDKLIRSEPASCRIRAVWSYYYRASPDRKTHPCSGGRVQPCRNDPRSASDRCADELVTAFPRKLQMFRLSHSWMGFCRLYRRHAGPHSSRNGPSLCMGLCGIGVGMAKLFRHADCHAILGPRPRVGQG